MTLEKPEQTQALWQTQALRQAQALWIVAPRRAELRVETLPPLRAGFARVRMIHSALSRGTERLVFEARAPESQYEAMRCPMQAGDFPYPVKYGYCAVGIVEQGPDDWRGARVFALHPHQTVFDAPLALLSRIPDDVPDARATLAANMETALNVVWDAGAGPGDRILVFGAGLVGLLIAKLCAALPGAEVTLVDPDSTRAEIAARLGLAWQDSVDPRGDCDIAINASANGAALSVAIDALGLEGTLVEASWHGVGVTPVSLGGAFHARRLKIVSSQVGQVAPARRPRWTYARRMAKALELLRAPEYDSLLTSRTRFIDLPAVLPDLLRRDASGVVPLICY